MKIAQITCSCYAVLTPFDMSGKDRINGAECQHCGMMYVILRRADDDLEIQVNAKQKKVEAPFRLQPGIVADPIKVTLK